jgi:hypothetical protein
MSRGPIPLATSAVLAEMRVDPGLRLRRVRDDSEGGILVSQRSPSGEGEFAMSRIGLNGNSAGWENIMEIEHKRVG